MPKRKTTTQINLHFSLITTENGKYDKCNYCDQMLKKHGSSTSSKNRHFELCKKRPDNTEIIIRQQKRGKIEALFFTVEQILTNETLAIIMNNCPKSIVDDYMFRRAFNPKLNRKSLDKRINLIYDDIKGRILSSLQHKSLSIAMDMWTNKTTKANILNVILLHGKNTFF